VGTEIHSDKYFYFAVPAWDIAQCEIDQFVANSFNCENLRELLKLVKSQSRFQRFLLRLQYKKDRIPAFNAVPFITALFDEGDDLPRRTDMLGTDAEMPYYEWCTGTCLR
jgi:hypothetical protein